MTAPVPCVFAVTGTSLTTGRLACSDVSWVPRLRRDLEQQPEAKGRVIIHNMGKGSQTSDWGVTNAPEISKLRPNFILFEDFGINDCAIGPVSLAQAAINFDTMVAEWRANIPGVSLTHQTMSPASAADVNRTNLQTYYTQGLNKASAAGIPSLNNTPNWPPITAANTNGATGGSYLPTGFSLWDVAAVWNSADKNANITLSGSDLIMTSGAGNCMARGTTGRSSGKRYFEVLVSTDVAMATDIGIAKAAASIADGSYLGIDVNGYGYAASGNIINNGVVSTGATYTTAAVISVAVDFTALKLWWAKNGTWQNGDPAAGTGGLTISSGTYYPACSASSGGQATARFTSGGGDELHPLFRGVFEFASYPTIKAWAISKMASFAPWAGF